MTCPGLWACACNFLHVFVCLCICISAFFFLFVELNIKKRLLTKCAIESTNVFLTWILRYLSVDLWLLKWNQYFNVTQDFKLISIWQCKLLSTLGVFGTLYCVTWRSKKGDAVDGKPNHLFSLLLGKSEEQLQRRKAWIATVKIVYGQSFPVHRTTCLCSQHVVNWNAKAKDSVPDHMVLTRSTPMKRSLELQRHPAV